MRKKNVFIRAEKPNQAATERKKFWSFKAAANGRGELHLYGIIESYTWWGDEITPQTFKSELDALGDISVLDVYINSDGGDVFAGQAIHSMLKRHKAKVNVYIDGIAASIASVIAMAGDTIYMPRNSMMMIHNPWTIALGNANEFRKLADDLDAMRESMIAAYQEKSGIERDPLIEMLDAETWLSAEKAVEFGFADEIEEQKQVAACITREGLTINGQPMDLSKYRNASKFIAATQDTDPIGTDPVGQGISPAFPIGKRVQVSVAPHIEGHTSGEVREAVLTWVYGILFDGMEDMGIHHWYVESEIQSTDGSDPSPENKKQKKSMPGMEMPASLKATGSQEQRKTPLSLLEKRFAHNKHRRV